MYSQYAEEILELSEQGEYLLGEAWRAAPLMCSADPAFEATFPRKMTTKLDDLLIASYPVPPDPAKVKRAGVDLSNTERQRQLHDRLDRAVTTLREIRYFGKASVRLLEEACKKNLRPSAYTDLPLVAALLSLLTLLGKVFHLLLQFDKRKFAYMLYKFLATELKIPHEKLGDVEDLLNLYTDENGLERLQSDLGNTAAAVGTMVMSLKPFLTFDLSESSSPAWDPVSPDPALSPVLSYATLKGTAMTWAAYALLLVPAAISHSQYGDSCFTILRIVLQDGYVLPVLGDTVVHTHHKFKELLAKGHKTAKEAKNLTSDTSKYAVEMAAKVHRKQRLHLAARLNVALNTFRAFPSLIPCKAPLLIALASLLRDEVLWTVRHWNNEAKTKAKKYVGAQWRDTQVMEAISLVSQANRMLEMHAEAIEGYWRALLSGPIHRDLAAMLEVVAPAANPSYSDMVETMKAMPTSLADGSFAAFRLNCLRVLTRCCVSPSPRPAEFLQRSTQVFFLSRFAESVHEVVHGTTSLSHLTYHRPLLAELVEKSVLSGEAMPHCAWIIAAVHDFPSAVHPWVPEEELREFSTECVAFVKTLVTNTLLPAVCAQLSCIRTTATAMADQVSGGSAAKLFMATQYSQSKHHSSAKHQKPEEPRPPPDAQLKLSALVRGAVDVSPLDIHDTRVWLTEMIREQAARFYHRCIDEVRRGLSALPVPSSLSIALRTTHHTVHHLLHLLGCETWPVAVEVLLRQMASPWCWNRSLLTLSPPRAPVPIHSSLVMDITRWVVGFVDRLLTENNIYNPRKQIFAPWGKGVVEADDLLASHDWVELATLLGPYGVSIVEGVLLNKVGDLACAVEEAVNQLNKACSNLEGHHKDMATVIEESREHVSKSELLSYCVKLGKVLAIRDLLKKGLDVAFRTYCPLVKRSLSLRTEDVDDAFLRLLGLTGTPLGHLDTLAGAKMKRIRDEAVCSKLPYALALSMLHPVWGVSGEFKVLYNGWPTNLQCMEVSIPFLFHFVRYNDPDISREDEYLNVMARYLNAASRITLCTGKGLNKNTPVDKQHAYYNKILFLKHLVLADPSINHSMLLNCLPQGLLREVDLITFKDNWKDS